MSAAAGVRSGSEREGDSYFEFDRPELRALVPAGARRVLDVGCGGGALGAALKAERGIVVCGVELFADAAARAATRLDEVVQADLDAVEDLPFERGSFDAMIFGDVLEHLRDPHRLLRMLEPWLAPGGKLVISVPNIGHWSVVLPLLLHDQFAYQDAGLLDRTHVHFFTLAEAQRMLVECGYAPEAAAATQIDVPAEAQRLAAALEAFGAGREHSLARLSSYQYLVVAGRLSGLPQ